jgi:hypothetical protein
MTYHKIPITADIWIADILGRTVLDQKGEFFQPGPIFANLVLLDNINRGSPRTLSPLFEVLNDGTITVDGAIHIPSYRHSWPAPPDLLKTMTSGPIKFPLTNSTFLCQPLRRHANIKSIICRPRCPIVGRMLFVTRVSAPALFRKTATCSAMPNFCGFPRPGPHRSRVFGPGYYGPGSYGPGVGASPSPPTSFSYFSSGGAAAGTPSVIPR